MSDQERWLNEILDILGLPRDTAYRDYTRELAERGVSLEQIYGTLRSRMNARLAFTRAQSARSQQWASPTQRSRPRMVAAFVGAFA